MPMWEKKQRRAQEAKNSDLAQSAAEAIRRMLINKRLSSKVNLERLGNLFDDIEAPLKKKVRSNKDSKLEPEPKDRFKGDDDDDIESVDEFEYGEKGAE